MSTLSTHQTGHTPFPDFSSSTGLRGLSAAIGIIATAVLFIVGFYPTAMTSPDKIPDGHGSRNTMTMPLEEETPEEIIHEASSKPTPQQPKVMVKTETPIDVPTPDVKLDFAVNPMIDVGLAVPAMPTVAANAPTAPAAFSINELDNEPALLFSPNPIYPYAAKRAKKEGTVTVRLVIDPEGRVLKVELQPGPDNEIFAKATLQAVKRWRFKPAEKNGKRVMCWVEVPVEFKLHR